MNGNAEETESGTLEDRLAQFWTEYERLEAGTSCIGIAGEHGMTLAALIIPELESDIASISEAARGLLIALGNDTQKHSKIVIMAQIKARAILKSMEPQREARTDEPEM